MFPGLYGAVFAPGDRSGQHILEAFSWLGIILLLMVAGMETDLRVIRRVGRAATYATVLDVLIPASAGVLLGYFLSRYAKLNATENTVVFVLFFAVMLALSLGIITVQLYSLIVAMAIVTSMMAPPLIKWTLSRSRAIQEPEFCPPGKERSRRT